MWNTFWNWATAQPAAVLWWMALPLLLLGVGVLLGLQLWHIHRTRQEDLERTATRLQTVMDTMVDALITVDQEGHILSVNRATEALLGWTPAELESRSLKMLLPETHHGQYERYLRHFLQAEPGYVLGRGRELLARHRDGHTLPVRVAVGRAQAAGEPFFVGVVTDVTQEHEVLQRERDTKSELLSFMKALTEHSIYSETDLHGTIVRVNTAFTQISGYSSEELVGRNHSIVNSGVHAPHFWQQMWQTVLGGRSWRAEICNRGKGGQLYWVDSVMVPLLNDQGQIQRIVSIRHDITARKANETLLRNTQQALEASNLAARIGTLEYDVLRGELHCSRLTQELLGLPAPYVASRTLTLDEAMAHVLQAEALREAIRASIDDGTGWDLEVQVHLPPAAPRWLRTIGKAEQRRGICVRLYGTVQDIDRSKRRELELAQARENAEAASRSKDMFLTTMSHELRTPMNAILGFGQMLEADPGLNEDQRDSVTEILTAGQHLLALINDVLELAKINAGKVDITLESVDLADVLRECHHLIQPLAQRQHVTLEFEATCFYTVLADRVRLKQVLLNLLSNAVKYNHAGGRVQVASSLTRDDECVHIAVKDNGMGIAADELAHLFQPFNRVGTSQSAIEGTGVGLSISAQLIEKMNGRIGVESTLGAGSTFWVELPVAQQALPEWAGAGDTPLLELAPPVRPYHILSIDDNPINQKLMDRLLRPLRHYQLQAALSPERGLQLAEQDPPDLILLDINMPGMNGYEVLQRLRSSSSSTLHAVPVIAVTSNAMASDVERGLQAGFTHYIVKPITDIDAFVHTVRQCLHSHPPFTSAPSP